MFVSSKATASCTSSCFPRNLSSVQERLIGMGTLDAASLSSMLSSDHGSSSHGSVMTSSNFSCTGPGDHHLFASQYSPLQGSFPLSAAGSGQQLAASKSSNFPAAGYTSAQMPDWPYSRDEKWVFGPSLEGTSSSRATNLRSNVIGAPESLNPSGYGRGLQRFHSAPSSFLECLADFNPEDVFTQASSDPLGDGEDDLLAWADNLTPIIERGPQQMDTEKGDASSSLSRCSEQFLVSQTDFERRISTISTPTQSFGKVEPRSLTRQDGLGGYAMPAIQDNMGESRTPSFQMANFLSPAESMSGTSEEKYGHSGNSTMASAYPPDHQISYLGNEPAGVSRSSGLWNSTSPGMLDGNSRLRGMGEITSNEPPGWLGSTSSRPSVGRTALEPAPKLGLIRHSSLPATSRPFGATMDLDDFISADSSTAPNSRTRANRGHATHPRSIAERVRRGKISERMKKLQDLVPNMERQSNTADMLDEVVEYVRQLQLQVQELSNTVVQLQEGLLHSD